MTTKTDTEQERAEFEAWANGRCELHLVNPAGRYSSATTQFAWEAWQARAALQSQVKNDTTLFCDLKTDEEKSAFFLSGRGYETGVIAYSIQNDVAMAYQRCAEYRKELEAMQAECERLRKDAERYRWLRDANINTLPYDDHGIGPEFPCGDDLDATIDSAMATETMRKQMES